MSNNFNKPYDNKDKNELSYFSQNKKDYSGNIGNGSANVNPPKGKLYYNIAFVVCVAVAVILVIDAIKIIAGGVEEISSLVAPVLCAVLLIIVALRYITRIRFTNCYLKYYLLIADAVVVSVRELSERVGVSEDAMRENLLMAVHSKYIPQGRFSDSKKLFFITGGEYNRYTSNPEKYEVDEVEKKHI